MIVMINLEMLQKCRFVLVFALLYSSRFEMLDGTLRYKCSASAIPETETESLLVDLLVKLSVGSCSEMVTVVFDITISANDQAPRDERKRILSKSSLRDDTMLRHKLVQAHRTSFSQSKCQ